MKKARLVLSDAAAADILEQADWYMAQTGPALGEGGHICRVACC